MDSQNNTNPWDNAPQTLSDTKNSAASPASDILSAQNSAVPGLDSFAPPQQAAPNADPKQASPNADPHREQPAAYPAPQGGAYPSPQGGAYPTPQGGAYPTPQGGAYPTPQGGAYPTPQGGAYPTPQGGAYPAPQGGAYPTPQGGAYPTPQANAYPEAPAGAYASAPVKLKKPAAPFFLWILSLAGIVCCALSLYVNDLFAIAALAVSLISMIACGISMSKRRAGFPMFLSIIGFICAIVLSGILLLIWAAMAS